MNLKLSAALVITAAFLFAAFFVSPAMAEFDNTAPATGTTGTVKGERTGRDSALVGTGLGWETGNLSLLLALDASLSSDQTEYDLSVGFRSRF
jgi:hypothetical protein